MSIFFTSTFPGARVDWAKLQLNGLNNRQIDRLEDLVMTNGSKVFVVRFFTSGDDFGA